VGKSLKGEAINNFSLLFSGWFKQAVSFYRQKRADGNYLPG
jgi:hypothetical protein